MKLVVLCLVSVITTSWGNPNKNSNDVSEKRLGSKITDIVSEDNLDGLLEAFKKFVDDGDVSDIFELNMNPTADDAINQLSNDLIEKGMDPLELDNQTLSLLGIVGSIKLTSGWLQNISTIKRTNDVIVSYNSASKKIMFSLPLGFNDLLFTYEYETIVTVFKFEGDAQGKIENLTLDINFTLDGDTGKIVLDNVDMKNSGKVTVKFSGDTLVDWINDAMTNVIEMVLHPVLIHILESLANSMANEIIDEANEYLIN